MTAANHHQGSVTGTIYLQKVWNHSDFLCIESSKNAVYMDWNEIMTFHFTVCPSHLLHAQRPLFTCTPLEKNAILLECGRKTQVDINFTLRLILEHLKV